MECAVFADSIKSDKTMRDWQSSYHFINFPFYDEPGADPSDYPWVPPEKNITDALFDLYNWLHR